jgi:hypothetical protein
MTSRKSDSWNDFVARLRSFHKKNGHCNVPTDCAKDPQLGRWLAMQRHKTKVGKLDPARIKLLDGLGIVWAPSNLAWEQLYGELCAYKKKHGNCAVPTKWPKNVRLADWVQRQRIWRKKGKLRADRLAKLEKLDFCWEIYKGCKTEKPAAPKTPAAPKPEEEAEPFNSERLYRLGSGEFVQFDGKGTPPPSLQKHLVRNSGDFPAYIPLPNCTVTFTIGMPWGKPARLVWRGKGKLPAKVMEFVQEQGALPPYT